MSNKFFLRELVFGLATLSGFGQSAPVPPSFQDLYSSLDSSLRSFDAQVSAANPNGSTSPTVFCAGLITANGNGGAALLTPNRRVGVALELDRLRQNGVQAVVVNVSFPLFYAPFFDFNGTSGDHQRYIEFYQFVARETRRRGMKFIAESGVLFPGVYSEGSGFNLTPFYRTLSETAYINGRATTAASIAAFLRPDFLSVGAEPDTEAHLTGQSFLRSPDGYQRMVRSIVQAIGVTGSTVPVGAGVGTWDLRAEEYISAMSTTGLDYIDLHIYPINFNLLSRTAQLSDFVIRLGKKVGVTEAWLLKQRDSEFSSIDVASNPAIFARDTFSFFAPLDQQFLSVTAKLANWKQYLFFSAFWAKYFWAYLDYGTVQGSTDSELILLSNQAAANALAMGLPPTDTMLRYEQVITPPLAENLATVVSAASFATIAIAPDAIASAFGAGLASVTAAASALPLPTMLGGVTVAFSSEGQPERLASLTFVSPNQVNFVTPTNLTAGWNTVTIRADGRVAARSYAKVNARAPTIFTQNQTGEGVPAAFLSIYSDSGQPLGSIPVWQGPSVGAYTPAPLSLGRPTDRAFLDLYGTGIRRVSSLAAAFVVVGGQSIPARFAGDQQQFPGLDQVQIEVPKSLAGRGLLTVYVVVDGLVSNVAQLNFQ